MQLLQYNLAHLKHFLETTVKLSLMKHRIPLHCLSFVSRNITLLVNTKDYLACLSLHIRKYTLSSLVVVSISQGCHCEETHWTKMLLSVKTVSERVSFPITHKKKIGRSLNIQQKTSVIFRVAAPEHEHFKHRALNALSTLATCVLLFMYLH